MTKYEIVEPASLPDAPDLTAPRGVLAGVGAGLVAWFVILAMFLGWYAWGW